MDFLKNVQSAVYYGFNIQIYGLPIINNLNAKLFAMLILLILSSIFAGYAFSILTFTLLNYVTTLDTHILFYTKSNNIMT